MLAYLKAKAIEQRRHMALPKVIRDNLATFVVGALVSFALLAAFLLLRPQDADAARLMVRVHDGEGHVHELPLTADDSLTVTTALGTNTIEVKDGEARVTFADCAGGNCLHQHPISVPGQQLICLPHQLWVEVVEAGAPDGELDVTAVSDSDDVDLVSR